jgi:DnaA-homolog protein
MTQRPQQLALDLLQPPRPSFDSFVVGRNAEAVAALRATAAGSGERFVYLWGSPGSGRSHLLQAVTAEGPSRSCSAADAPIEFDPSVRLYLIDDVERLSEAGQHRLFVLLNEVRAAAGAAVVTAGDRAPAQLALRGDVRTRLGWGLVYQLHELSDAEKEDALRAHAAARGIALPPEVLAYVLTHMPRDMRTLMAVLDALDAYAMAAKRAITVPLVREWAQSAE